MSTMAVETAVRRPRREAAPETPAPASAPAPARSRERIRWAVCAALTGAALVLWAARDGGYSTVIWLPSAAGLVALAAWTRLVFGRTTGLGVNARRATVLLALYTAWSYASITWAVDKGTALLGSDRTLLYLVVFVVAAQLEWTRRRLELALSVYLLALGVVAIVTLARLALGPAAQLLQDGQLVSPTGYHNSTAALGTIGAAAAILAASGRWRSPLLRAALCACATCCLDLSLLAQSRGWLYTLPVIVVVLLALTPARGRAVAWAAIPFAAAAATLPWVLHGYRLADVLAGPSGERTVATADLHTARAALVAALVAALAAALAARLGRTYQLDARARSVTRFAARTAAVTTIAVVLGAIVVFVASGSAASSWRQFTTDAPVKPGVSLFEQLGSGRWDFWRVGIDSFLHHPLGGLGQDNFAQAYTAARHTSEEPLWVHSLEVRLLVHTGAVGMLLFVGFVVCALIAARRAGRGTDRRTRLAIAAALAPLIVWLVHGSVDWFWEMPVLSGPAFAFLGAAAALEPRRPAATRGRAPWRAASRGVVIVLVAAAALVALVPAYLGEHALNTADALAATAPGAALGQLHNAASLEPLSSAPAVLATAINLNAGRVAPALAQARTGIDRNPGSWLLWLEDGLADGANGQLGLERAALAHARALDSAESVIALAQSRAGTSDPLTISEAAAIFAARTATRVGA